MNVSLPPFFADGRHSHDKREPPAPGRLALCDRLIGPAAPGRRGAAGGAAATTPDAGARGVWAAEPLRGTALWVVGLRRERLVVVVRVTVGRACLGGPEADRDGGGRGRHRGGRAAEDDWGFHELPFLI